jgi:glycine cleavage system transcriptional repressor
VSSFAVSAIGRDRPGIVAAISRELLELRGNIEDSQMSILRGHFAVMLIVSVPDEASEAELQRRMERVGEELGLEAVAVSAVEDLPAGIGPTHVLSVYGADRPGIVHAVSSALAERGISITDLETRVAGQAEAPVYVMLMEVAAGGADPAELEAALRAIGERESLDVSLRELTADAL